MTIDTIWLYALIIVCGMYTLTDAYLGKALASVCVIFTWILFLIIRYLRCNVLMKAGICLSVGSVFNVVINDIVNYIFYLSAEELPGNDNKLK